MNSIGVIFMFSIMTACCFCFDLPLTPAPVPECSALQLESVHYMLQPSLAHLVCAYAAFHTEMSRGQMPLRAVVLQKLFVVVFCGSFTSGQVFSPGKHQLGNRVLELASVMLLSICTERAL
jgi:hypothetical protein